MSLPSRSRPEPYKPRYYLDYLAIALFCFIICLPLMCSKARGSEEDESRAALALARAARERSVRVAAETQPICFTDPALATAKALKDGKPIMWWVGGLQCKDHAEFRAAVGDVVHCHVASHDGDRSKRVVFAADGVEFYILEENLTKARAERLRSKWKESTAVPGAKAKVIEEFSRNVLPVRGGAVARRTGDDGPPANGGFWIPANPPDHPPVPEGWTLRTVDGVHYLTEDQVPVANRIRQYSQPIYGYRGDVVARNYRAMGWGSNDCGVAGG
jgi:hypothetical protein